MSCNACDEMNTLQSFREDSRMNGELVSVIIPTYNRDNTLQRAINSVLSQSYEYLELIIVDDNSNDNTESIVKNIKDARVRYIKNETNQGPSEARNIGIRNATGSYIAFQDSDDYWLEDKLEKQMSLFNQEPELGMVYTSYLKFSDNGKRIYVPSKEIEWSKKSGNIYDHLLEKNKIGTPTMLIRKECLDNVGVFCRKIYALEDWELSIRIASKYKIGFLDEALLYAYSSKEGVDSNVINQIEALCYLIGEYKDDFIRLSLLDSRIMGVIAFSVYNEQAGMDVIREMLIPNAIESQASFEILLKAVERGCKFKQYYDLLMKIETIGNVKEYITEKMEKNQWSSAAIYGLGGIGQVVLKYFNNASVDIKYGIDQNASALERQISVIQPKDIKDDVDVIIVTPIISYNSIARQLKEYTQSEIISAETFFDSQV